MQKRREHRILDNQGIPFGFFRYRDDRDYAMRRYCNYGIALDVEVEHGN